MIHRILVVMTLSAVVVSGCASDAEDGAVSDSNGPIFLYIGTIYRMCLEEGLEFEEEVHRTYLHEFGHHIGWDEDDIAERDLD